MAAIGNRAIHSPLQIRVIHTIQVIVPGRFQNRRDSEGGAPTCSFCEEGYYAEEDDLLADGTRFASCVSCKKLSSAMEVDKGTSCPTGTTLATIAVQPGYWRATTDSTIILECPDGKQACPGGSNVSSYCSAHEQGPYCAVCANGFFKQDGGCIKCTDSIQNFSIKTWVFIGTVLILLFILMFHNIHRVSHMDCLTAKIREARDNHNQFMKNFKYDEVKTKFKIAIVCYQILTQLPLQLANINYPPIVTNVYTQVAGIVSLELYQLIPIDCLHFRTKNRHFEELLELTLTPLGVISVGAVYYAYMYRTLHRDKIVDFNTSMLFYFFLFTYIIFIPCTNAILEVYHCDSRLGGDMAYLHTDYTTRCYSRAYNTMFFYATIFLFIYPIGIPALYFSVLFRRRHDIDPNLRSTGMKARMSRSVEDVNEALSLRGGDHTLYSLGFLFESYEPEFWWWELLVCVHRLMMGCAHIFLASQDVALPCILLIIALVAVKFQMKYSPYILDSDDIFAEICQWQQVGFLIVTLMFQTGAASSSTGWLGVFLVALLSSVFIILASYCLITAGNELWYFKTLTYQTNAEVNESLHMQHKPVDLESSDRTDEENGELSDDDENVPNTIDINREEMAGIEEEKLQGSMRAPDESGCVFLDEPVSEYGLELSWDMEKNMPCTLFKQSSGS